MLSSRSESLKLDSDWVLTHLHITDSLFSFDRFYSRNEEHETTRGLTITFGIAPLGKVSRMT